MELSPQYVAGFFDGEGSISIHRGAKKAPNDWRVTVNVAQIDGRVLFFLKEKFGGYLKQSPPRSSRGIIGRSPMWKWQVSLRKAERFLQWIEPHTVIKRDQIELALEFMSKRKPRARPWKHDEGDTRGYSEMAQRMRGFNHKGGNNAALQ